MFLAILTLLTALSIAGVAAWFSIVGIMSIFAGAPTASLIMGGVLEAGKLLTASWLYRNWKKSPLLLRIPLIFFTVVLMFITSMGIFGFLSKAHIEQGASTGDSSAKIERLDQRISKEQLKIEDFEKQITQLDDLVNKYSGLDKVSLAVALRKTQQPQRLALNKEIESTQALIDKYTDEKFSLQSEIRGYELEVGPVKYIAALIYNDPKNNLESAVRIVTLIIVLVFDPFAVILLIAANYSLMQKKDISISNEAIEDNEEKISPDCFSVPESKTNSEIKTHEKSTTIEEADELSLGSSEIPIAVSKEISGTKMEVIDETEETSKEASESEYEIYKDHATFSPEQDSATTDISDKKVPVIKDNIRTLLTGFSPKTVIETNRHKLTPKVSGWINVNLRRR